MIKLKELLSRDIFDNEFVKEIAELNYALLVVDNCETLDSQFKSAVKDLIYKRMQILGEIEVEDPYGL